MKRSMMKWISLTAASAILAAGCAGVGPDRNGPNRAGLTNNNGMMAGSTTGDLDACAAALGNAAPFGGSFIDATDAGRTGGAAAGTRAGAAGTRAGAAGTRAGAAGTRAGAAGANRANGAARMNRGGGANWAGAMTGESEITANGVLLGNVALVALPSTEDMPISPRGGVPGAPAPAAPAPGAPGGPGGPGAPGTPAGRAGAPGTPAGRAGAPGTPAGRAGMAPGRRTTRAGEVDQPGGAFERAGTPGMAAGTTPGPVGRMAPGAAPRGGATGMAAGVNGSDAIRRIQAACTQVSQIRVVSDARDRAELARITLAMRHGQPITEFMDTLAAINRRAQAVAAGGNARDRDITPGTPPPARRPDLPRTMGAPGGPAPGMTGTPPGEIGPGRVPPANR